MHALSPAFRVRDPVPKSRAPPRRFRPVTYLVVAGADLAALITVFVLSYFAAAAVNRLMLGRDFYATLAMDRFWQFLVIAFGTILVLYARGHYRQRLPFWLEARDISAVLALAMLFDCSWQFALKQDLSRLWVALAWLGAIPIVITSRFAAKRLLLRAKLWQLPALLVASGAQAKQAMELLSQEKTLGYEFVGTMEPDAMQSTPGFWDVQCVEDGAQFVMLALSGRELEQNAESLGELARENIPHGVIPPLHDLPVAGVSAQYFLSHDMMLLVAKEGLRLPLNRVLKSFVDFTLSASALVVLSPLMLVLALLIALDGGPVFYRHTRIGKRGKVFSCLKFRTMLVNADAVLRDLLAREPAAAEEWQKDFKLREDPRVTAVGQFLRRTSLDELPQLINVLRGDMSLVGPRPIVVTELGRYGRDIAYYFASRPGITGLWQVSGRNDLSYNERVRLDAWYVRNWSLWHDIAILAKTVVVVVKRAGAY